MNRFAHLYCLLSAAISLPSLAAEATTVHVEEIRCVGGRYGLAIEERKSSLGALGPPVKEVVDEIEKWDGYTATRKTLSFRGMNLSIIEFSNDANRVIVTRAEITSPAWNQLVPFKIGQATSASQAVFGAAAKHDPNLNSVYGSGGTSITVASESGRVSRVVYDCYSG